MSVGKETTDLYSDKFVKPSQIFSRSTTALLPTIREAISLNEGESTLCSNSDPNHNLEISIDNGKLLPTKPGSLDDLNDGQCLPKFHRSVSFGLGKFRPNLCYSGSLDLTATPPEAIAVPDEVMLQFLPVINVEHCDDKMAQGR